MFFRVALLYPIATRFTIDGYTLFSTAHIVDYLNLVALLLPGVLMVVVAMMFGGFTQARKSATFGYLLVTAISVLLAAFVFEPKLGMPRDWDLFSFPAIPLAALSFWYLLEGRVGHNSGRTYAFYAVLIGVLSLSARVITQMDPEASVKQIGDYYQLDKLKSKNALLYLGSYFMETNNTVSADSVGTMYAAFPDEVLYRKIEEYFANDRFDDALVASRLAAQVNPMSWRAFQYMGTAYYRAGRNAEAVQALDTALGLNQYNAISLIVLGAIRWQEGRLSEAEVLETRAMKYGPQYALPSYILSQLSGLQEKYDEQLRYLLIASSKLDASADVFTDLAKVYLRKGRVNDAVLSIRKGLQMGMDRSLWPDLVKDHPELGQYFPTDH